MKAFFLTVILIGVSLRAALGQDSKSGRIVRVLNTVEAVQKLASGTAVSADDPEAKLEEKLDDVLLKCTSEELGKIAVICLTIAYPQDAGDIYFDKFFDRACWRCITILLRKRSKENLDALRYVERFARFDGGDKMAFDELMEKYDKPVE